MMDKLCYSIANMGYEYYEFIIHYFGTSYIEIRVDAFQLELEDLKNLLNDNRTSKIIVSYPNLRKDLQASNIDCSIEEILSHAIDYGADYIDIGNFIDKEYRAELIKKARRHHCKVIISHHFTFYAPGVEKICDEIDGYYAEGADIVKIVIGEKTTANAESKIKALYKKYNDKKGRLIAFLSGFHSTKTRWDSLAEGAPFTYVALGDTSVKAPGELTYYDLFNPMEERLCGSVELPSSKSVAQRAIMLGALAEGKTELYCVTLCDDTVSAISLARSIGAKVDYSKGTVRIEGIGAKSANDLNIPGQGFFKAGESGFLARTCVAMSAVAGKDAIVTGEKTLMKRKFGREFGALQTAGISIELNKGELLPAQVHGTLDTERLNLSGVYGSQLISGFMMMLPLRSSNTRIQIINAASFNYLGLTKTVMQKFGVKIKSEEDRDRKRVAFDIPGNSHYVAPAPYKIERDWSAAAMMLTAGAVAGKVRLKGLAFSSHQPDSIIIPILNRCGADLELQGFTDESSMGTFAATTASKSILIPFIVDITDIPDLFPALFILALRCAGPSIIHGISRLRNKESDRATCFFDEFKKLGVKLEIKDEEMTIYGSPMMTLLGGKVSSHGDHRLAMALLVASLLSVGKIEIDDITCLSKSYPDFRHQLECCIVDKDFHLPE
jgi:3-phosphoshikimate 1-carboxyvinyltransferase